MRGSQFENHLLFLPKVDGLSMFASTKIPEMQLMAVTA